MSQNNDCANCIILEIMPCPLQEEAIDAGQEFVTSCSMKPTIQKLYDAGRSAGYYNNQKARKRAEESTPTVYAWKEDIHAQDGRMSPLSNMRNR